MKLYWKRLLSLLLMILMVLSIVSCTKEEKNQQTQTPSLSEEDLKAVKDREVRAVWIAYNEVGEWIKTYPEKEAFTAGIKEKFKALADAGFHTVYLHVRAFSDAFYHSDYFPSTAYFGAQGTQAPYDVLQIAVAAAHQLGLKLEAWINPYRVSNDQNLDALANTNPAKIWLTDDDPSNDTWVIKINGGGLYYNPAVPECQELIVNGVKEIVTNYQVDGIHFDDYFYPSTEAYIDETEFQAYQASGGQASLEDWRCGNVSSLVQQVYRTVKAQREALLFGISPAASIQENKRKHYADLQLWATEKGYVDYLCPQIYFGFENQVRGFISTTKSWLSLMRDSHAKLYIGLPLYKSGKVDEFADDTDGSDPSSPRYEFVNHSDIIMRQINYLRQVTPYDGFAVFSYSYLFSNTDAAVQKEAENIKSVLTAAS